MDKRKKYFLLIDVETAGPLGASLVYDLGLAITDKQGNIYESRSFLIKEIWDQKNLMQTAYYARKIPKYEKDLKLGKFEIVQWSQAVTTINDLIEKWNVSTIAAYNLYFDKTAIAHTHKTLGHSGKAISKKFAGKIDQICLWGLACETIFKQKSFQKMAKKHNWVSKKGNKRTTAEVAFRYLTNKPNFEESHTGLEDVKIETQIMARCFRQKKKISGGIISHPWRIPQRI